MRHLLASTRSFFMQTPRPTRDAEKSAPSAGETLYQAIVDAPAFPLGEAVPLGPPMEKARSIQILERIEVAREAFASYDGNPTFCPVLLSFVAMDWAEVTHASKEHGDLKISIPTILDGRWVARDLPLLLDVAAAVVVDASTTRTRTWTAEDVYAKMESLKLVATALYTADNDSGYHINLPSPFGPAEIRRHDISGSPYEAYDLPDTQDFVNLPHAYEVEEYGHGKSVNLHVTRARTFNEILHDCDTSRLSYEDRKRVFQNLAKFVPVPKPYPNPHPTRSVKCFGIVRGRTILTLRRHGSDVFELPGFLQPSREEWGPDEWETRQDRLQTSIGCVLVRPERYDYLAHAKDVRGFDADTDMGIGVDRYEIEGEPSPHDDVIEVHWLNVDAPDRPVSPIMEQVLLPQTRERLAKADR